MKKCWCCQSYDVTAFELQPGWLTSMCVTHINLCVRHVGDYVQSGAVSRTDAAAFFKRTAAEATA